MDERLKSNAYNPGADPFGMKAHQDLVVTRGKGFRTEKTKKKKGSYRGGAIDTGVHSVKFNYDSE